MSKPVVGITGDIKGNKYSVKVAYADAVENAGAYPFFLAPPSTEKTIKGIARTIDALLISGGRDISPAFYDEKLSVPARFVSPRRFHFERRLLKEIMILKKPVLGICYGIQFLNVFFGGTLYQDLKKQKADTINHKSGHRIKIYNKSKLYYILNAMDIVVNSTHNQGIKRIGRDLLASACSRDNLIEAIELKDYPYCIGVQWHPEKLSNRYSQRLFKSFINAAESRGM